MPENSKTIAVKLTPKAFSNRIGEMRTMPDGMEALTIYVTAPPDKNKANEAMIRLLAKYLGIAQSRLTVIQGHTNRNKLVRIDEK